MAKIMGSEKDDIIVGTSGVDSIFGQGGNDTIHAGDGNDAIDGGSGNDTLYGGNGNDKLIGNIGDDSLFGDTGDDMFVEVSANGSDLIHGGEGYDTINYDDNTTDSAIHYNVFSGQINRVGDIDTLNSIENILATRSSMDTVSGEGCGINLAIDLGAGTVNGLPGGRIIIRYFENASGGNGNDSIAGSAVGNILEGGAGNDTMFGAGGDDTLLGGSGDDLFKLSNRDGSDAIKGGDGKDAVTYNTYDKSALLTFNTADGTLSHFTNIIHIEGVEVLTLLDVSSSILDASGEDNGVNIALLGNSSGFFGGFSTFRGFTDILGSAFNDSIAGNGLNNTIDGGNGNDTLFGGIGNDTVYGSAGADLFKVSANDGSDSLYGGKGSDTLLYTVYTPDTVTVYTAEGTLSHQNNMQSLNEIEIVTVQGNTNTWINASGEVHGVSLTLSSANSGLSNGFSMFNGFVNATGSAFNDTIIGSKYDNILNGGDGQDDISGGAGNDTLTGGKDADRLSGGDGNDSFYLDGDRNWEGGFSAYDAGTPGHAGSGQMVSIQGYIRNNDVFDGEAGNDVLKGTAGNDALFLDDSFSPFFNNLHVARWSGIERIEAGDGNDIVDMTSYTYSYGNITLDGGNGDDILWSSDGNDILIGGNGNDSLRGNAGNDLLEGGFGNDSLFGGDGSDLLKGGIGNDIYTYTTGHDIIEDIGGSDTLIITNYTQKDLTFISTTAVNSFNDGVTDLMLGFDNGDTLTINNYFSPVYTKYFYNDRFNDIRGSIEKIVFADGQALQLDSPFGSLLEIGI